MAPPMREPTKWINHTLPQTLQIAVFLLYIGAAFDALAALMGGLNPVLVITVAITVGAGWGIANEKKAGWYTALVIAALPFVFVALGMGSFEGNLIGLMIAIAKVALLVHPESRNHVRIWFK